MFSEIPSGSGILWIKFVLCRELLNHSSEVILLVCLVCHNKVPQTVQCKQQKFIVSWFWRLEVQKQDIERVDSFRGPGGKDLFQTSLLGLQSAIFVFTWCSSFYACLSPNTPFHKDTSHIGSGPTLMVSFFYLITSVKTLSPNEVTFRYWRLGLQHTNI